MHAYLSLSLPLWPEVFLSFPLPVLPFSASSVYYVNTDFKFPGKSLLLCILPALLILPSFSSLYTLIFERSILYLSRTIVKVFYGKQDYNVFMHKSF